MAISGNKMAADVGGPSVTKESLARARERAVEDTPEPLSVHYGRKTGKNTKSYDIMPPAARKQADKVSRGLGRMAAVGTNLNNVVQTVSNKKLALPKALQRALDIV